MLKTEFMKWLFRFSIIKPRFQLRYYRMNNNSKRDISFFYADAWHDTQNRTFTSRTLKICLYHSPWVTKPVLCPFHNHWIYFWIMVRVFRAQLGLFSVWQVWPCLSVKDIDEQCEFPQRPRWAMRVSTILTLDRMDFHAIFQQINLNLSRKLYELKLTFGLQNLVGKTPLPESFACLFDRQRTFRNPLRAVFSKIEILPATAKFSSLYAGASRVPPRVLAVWAKTLRGQLSLHSIMWGSQTIRGWACAVRNGDQL